MPSGEELALEVLSNFEDVPASQLTKSKLAPDIRRISLPKYLHDKVQYLVERNEAQDLADIGAILKKFPAMQNQTQIFVLKQDTLLLTERLLNWQEEDLRTELAIYGPDLLEQALDAKIPLLSWIKEA